MACISASHGCTGAPASPSRSSRRKSPLNRAGFWSGRPQRNVELIWLTGRLTPDFKTIADFRKDNAKAIGNICREFVLLRRRLKLFSEAMVAIDGSKFKAVNNRDKNFTQAKPSTTRSVRRVERQKAIPRLRQQPPRMRL